MIVTFPEIDLPLTTILWKRQGWGKKHCNFLVIKAFHAQVDYLNVSLSLKYFKT